MVRRQEVIWMARWKIRQAVLAKAGKELETIEAGETGKRGEGETDYGS